LITGVREISIPIFHTSDMHGSRPAPIEARMFANYLKFKIFLFVGTWPFLQARSGMAIAFHHIAYLNRSSANGKQGA
jgi:hypothetical protein